MIRRILLLGVALIASPAVADDGLLPVGADGKPLNLDFETGTLKDWKAEGTAFRDQPIKGDTVHPRRSDSYSRHQGQYWIGGFERHGDKPTGTLTSVAFKVTHRWASFLVGGGPWPETRVELLHKGQAFFKTSGLEAEDLQREVIDLIKYMGQEIQVRVVDQHTGHWGHINFDDFRFHEKKPDFPARPKKEQAGTMDAVKNAGLSPEKAAAAMTVPPEFTVTLFAGEPDVQQPVAFCIDDRGRLWVVEYYTYPKRLPFDGPLLPEAERKKGDRIVIFEDTNGDGKFDKRTVFLEGLNLATGIEVGFGGVWVGAAPYLMFIPILEGDKPGEIKVLLDGWDATSDTHETLNSFTWGPDGWLYGCHGVFTRSMVGKPGTPEKDRTHLNCAVWRYHPTKHVFEVFSEGTSNPWGLDYNEYGEFFIEACVIPHCFHMIQGGRYLRQAGQHNNPHTYADINTIADHLHYLGATPHGGNNRSDSAGGGHAHSGLMCYLGGTWPKKYHGQLFMGNIHGKRINMDILKPKGSGYVASHGPDFLLANDEWARFINLKYGPDGNVYLIDWYDKQACHRNEPEIWDRTNGRIYKITLRGSKPVTGIDLQKCMDEELVKYQLHENEWYVRHARRILQERTAKRTPDQTSELRKQIVKALLNSPDERMRLKGLWALHAAHLVDSEIGSTCMSDKSGHLRGWILNVMADGKYETVKCGTSFIGGLPEMAPIVRRRVASYLLGLKDDKDGLSLRGVFLHYLLKADDGLDHNLPYLYWYVLEPIAGTDPEKAMQIAAEGNIPALLQFAARRISSTSKQHENDVLVNKLQALLKERRTDGVLLILRGMNEGFRGRKNIPAPSNWRATADRLEKLDSSDARSLTNAISIAFGDAKALAEVRSTLADTSAPMRDRQAGLTTLVNAGDKELAPVLQKLVAEPGLRSAAIRALAGYDDPKTPSVLLSQWKSFNSAEVRDALSTLASRPAYANALLDAVAAKTVPPLDVSADILRAMRNLPDKSVGEKIAKVWGAVRDTPADRKKMIANWRNKLFVNQVGDLALGRAIYAKTCQNCHTLYGLGGKIGPDITGSNRNNLDYLLENIFDPSAVIPKDYAQTIFQLNNGRTVTGILKGENGNAYSVQTPNELLLINKGDVDEMRPSTISIMPDDQMTPFSEHEVRSLFAYLRHNQQAPMLATVENAKDLFNGKDLTGWSGDPKLWSVENGEIVGKSPGIKKNEFLKSDLSVENFRLTLKVKLTPNKENSGVQFRSEPLPDGEMRGYQADIGQGWWGKLYEESGRALLWDKSGEAHVKVDDWNEYVIEAVGPNIKTWINGKPCVDLVDTKGARRGIFGLQIHSGGPMEVRFKDLKLEVLKK